MGDRSPIEWLRDPVTGAEGATINPIRARRKADIEFNKNGVLKVIREKKGWACVRVSPGCRLCYASQQNVQCGNNATRLGTGLPYTVPALQEVELYLDEPTLLQPLRWKRGRRIFWCSMTDWMGDFVPRSFRVKMLAVMAMTPRHTHITLTKRADEQFRFLSNADLAMEVWAASRGLAKLIPIHPAFLQASHEKFKSSKLLPLRNHLTGISVENQEYYDLRMPWFIKTPARYRWISFEPLLGLIDPTPPEHRGTNVNTDDWLAEIVWAVAGGESGSKASPMHPVWARTLRDRCNDRTDMGRPWPLPFFFKQWGQWRPMLGTGNVRPAPGKVHSFGDGYTALSVGKHAAGAILDGRIWNEVARLEHA